MSNERDELDALIGTGFFRDSYYGDQLRSGWNRSSLTALVFDAGYRKAAPQPRTITTVEELDALGFNAIVLHDEGFRVLPAQKHAEDMRWYVPGCLEYIRTEALLPATVVHEPAAQ